MDDVLREKKSNGVGLLSVTRERKGIYFAKKETEFIFIFLVIVRVSNE